MTRKFSLEELKRRKLVQWALAYVAGAWVVVEVFAVLADSWGVAPGIVRGLHVALAFGFFVTLVLAWYHGERGEQRATGPELLMVAALVVIAAAAITVVGPTADDGGGDEAPTVALPPLEDPKDSIPRRSIAVLPLTDNSPDPDDAWFARAMTEEIHTALSTVTDLQVKGLRSSERFGASGMTVGQFATGLLKAASVLEGSAQLVGDSARITVKLVDAASDTQLWEQTHDVALVDIYEAQAGIARQVARSLAARFTDEDRSRILDGSTADPVARERFLQAERFGLEKEDERGARADLLRAALGRDPEFGLAWEALGTVHFFERLHAGCDGFAALTDSIRAAFDRARETAGEANLQIRSEATQGMMLSEDPERAVSLLTEASRSRPGDVALWSQLHSAHWYDGDIGGAALAMHRALRLDPLDAGKAARLAYLYIALGMDSSADAMLNEAIRDDPSAARPWWQRLSLALYAGDRQESRAAVDRIYELDPVEAPLADGLERYIHGDVEGAFQVVRDFPLEPIRDAWAYSYLAAIGLANGDRTFASERLGELRELYECLPDDPVSTRLRLEETAVLGDTANAAEALARYVAAGGRRARQIRFDPLFETLRRDSAFAAGLDDLAEIVRRQRERLEDRLSGAGA